MPPGSPVPGYNGTTLSLLPPAAGWPTASPGSPLTSATPALRPVGGARGDHLLLAWDGPDLGGRRIQLEHTVVFDSVKNAISSCGFNEYFATTGVEWDQIGEDQVFGRSIL